MELTIGTLSGETTKLEEAVLRSLARAYAQGCHGKFAAVKEIRGVTIGLYGAFTTGFYRVTVDSCTCEAGRHDQMCKHRAAMADLTGQLDALVPEFYRRFTAPVAPVEIACDRCHGEGYVRSYYGGRFSDWYAVDCHECGKTGRIAA